jgi:hypothetical protein
VIQPKAGSKPTGKTLLAMESAGQFWASPSDLFYDDTADVSNSAASKFKKFINGGAEFPPLGSDKNFKAGCPSNGFLKKGQQVLMAPAIHEWARQRNIELLQALVTPADKFDYKKDKTNAYNIPVIGTSATGWVLLGVLKKPDAAPGGIDWESSIDLTARFPRLAVKSTGPALPILQKASGAGRNAFGDKDTSTMSEYVRLYGLPTRASGVELARTLNAVETRLHYWVKAGPQPASAKLLFFPDNGCEAPLEAILESLRPKKKVEGAGKTTRPSMAAADFTSAVYLTYKTGSMAGARLCVARRFNRVNILHFQRLANFFQEQWLESQVIGLETAGLLGYLKDDGYPDIKKGAQNPSCTRLWTQILCRSIHGAPLDGLFAYVWRLVRLTGETVSGSDLLAEEARAGLTIRQVKKLIPALYGLNAYLTRYSQATTAEELSAVLSNPIEIQFPMSNQTTESLVSSELWSDLSASQRALLQKLHRCIVPERTAEQQAIMLHGIGVGICISSMVAELAKFGRRATRTNGLPPSHMKGARLVGQAITLVNQLVVLSESKQVDTKHLAKHAIAAETASKKALFNDGFIMALGEISV